VNIQPSYKRLLFQLYEMYDDREAANIADLVIENITGFKKVDRLINKQFSLNEEQLQLLENYTNKLLKHEPVQYVLHEAWFAGTKLYVDENVLIPRPETEELVKWIIDDSALRTGDSPLTILDIGTGSGCIPIALKKKLPSVEMHAIDISAGALNIARQNASTQQTEINFHLLDILDKTSWKQLRKFDIIVSNPPYVKQSEAKSMQQNVLKYEPHLALFVEDEDALKFYKAIAEFGSTHLYLNGNLFFEIHETLAKEVSALLHEYNYSEIELRNDLQNKHRMIKATYSSSASV
jgi:release factor glutamine methyltransferase